MAVDVAKQTLNQTISTELQSSEAAGVKTLLHELQLGEQLNESVHQARRADFSLMLAMLCDDVREQSQFVLPRTELLEKEYNNSVLRKQFDLPEPAPLALDNIEKINQYNQAQDLDDTKLTNIHFSNAFNPKPLSFRDDEKHVCHDVLTNTTLTCQEKHHQQKADALLNKRLSMNVEGWLKNVQTSLVKSRLMSDLAA